MTKLNKKSLVASLMYQSMFTAIPCTAGMYDMRPKNHWRGGAIGKGGKIKYPKR